MNNTKKPTTFSPAPPYGPFEHSLSDAELTLYVRKVSQTSFQRSFVHEAHWNARLRTTGGRFFVGDKHLELNPKFAAHPDFEKIVRHELCHYHLYQARLGYRHRDSDFKVLLKAVGGLRYSPDLVTEYKYRYRCKTCGQLYKRRRRINLQRYRCSRCGGSLKLLDNAT